MKILILRANSLRHRYLTSLLKFKGFEVIEIIEINGKTHKFSNALIKRHFEAREQIEQDFFYDLVKSDREITHQLHVENVNQEVSLSFAKKNKPDLLITFGCRILNSDWLDSYKDQIMGIHLGLSPYYRGSGTNFFPFVNNELGAIGYTLMKINQGIDTGAIYHQAYGSFFQGDGIHTVGTRLMRNMFFDIVNILQKRVPLSDSIEQPIILKHKLYKKSDFTHQALEKALDNIRLGSIDFYLENVESEKNKFPLIRKLSI